MLNLKMVEVFCFNFMEIRIITGIRLKSFEIRELRGSLL